jgi:2-methylcitrate dehydratase PrpD
MQAPQMLPRLLDLAALDAREIPSSARDMARFSLFDGFAVAMAAAQEPVAKIVRGLVADEGGRPAASVVGLANKVPARAAALANGTIMHALDYDDTHFGHIGHPTAVVLPAALAVAEEIDAPASALLDALLIGAEASIRLGLTLGRAHYDRGFHMTATAGAFGATVAAARLRGLPRERLAAALSLVATRASGLKSQFGTMGKPFNAGLAASNGVEAVALAARGFVAADDGLGGPQGFVDVLGDPVQDAWAAPGFLFEDIKHKLHACCHGLHAALEALREARRGASLEGVRALEIRVNPRWLKVCDLKRPRTGLEAKFSYAMTAAMTLGDIDTASDAAFTEALCHDARLVAFLPNVVVTGDPSLADTAASVYVETASGATRASHDLAERLPAAALERGLRAKASALLGAERAAALWEAVARVETLSARELGDNLRPA